jgi:hypothetical protein
MENFQSKNVLTKFRVSVHHLEVKKGRHLKIKYFDRKCKLCNEEAEEEIHFLIICKIRCYAFMFKFFHKMTDNTWTLFLATKKEKRTPNQYKPFS